MKRFGLFPLVLLVACGGGTAEETTKTPTVASATATASATTPPPVVDHSKEIQKQAAEAYVFGYPALFMERQKRAMTTNVRLQLGTFAHATKMPKPEDTDVLPSLDTMLSSAWLELHDGAWALKLPDMADRWFAIEMFDAYGEPIGVVGKKTTGTKAQVVAITGPGFKGTLPPGAKEIKSTTSTVWLLGRTRVTGAADVAKVSSLLKSWALAPVPPTTAPTSLPPAPMGRPQDLKFAGPEIFDELAEVMKTDAAPDDVHAPADLGKLGKSLPQELLAAASQGIKDGAEHVEQALEKLATRKNGWDSDTSFGQRGADPVKQAAWVLRGLDWPVSSEGLVYIARVDDGDRVLSGAHEYALHFDKGKAPPAKAFWSVSLYNSRSGGLVPNAKRWSINDSGVHRNADGSIDISIQADPGKVDASWLPAPKGEAFMVVLRVYQPDDSAASWDPPAIKRIK